MCNVVLVSPGLFGLGLNSTWLAACNYGGRPVCPATPERQAQVQEAGYSWSGSLWSRPREREREKEDGGIGEGGG